jgi:hypothetical protein
MTGHAAVQTWTQPEPRLRFGTPFASAMPAGPWSSEPDKMQWLDDATDLDCLIVRGSMGALCGYVGVPPEHPWHGKGYSECLKDDCTEEWCYEHSPNAGVRVHGGLTFASACSESEDPSRWICHVPLPGRPHDVWWFGFDCAHSGDLTLYDVAKAQAENNRYPWTLRPEDEYRDIAYVQGEVTRLARQLAAVAG